MISVIDRARDPMLVPGTEGIDLQDTDIMTGFFTLFSSDGARNMSLRIGKEVRLVKSDMKKTV